MNARRDMPPARMLIVEDDVRYAEWLRHHLDVLCPRASVSRPPWHTTSIPIPAHFPRRICSTSSAWSATRQ